MPPKAPKAAKGKQKPQVEEREESLQAVVSRCGCHLQKVILIVKLPGPCRFL